MGAMGLIHAVIFSQLPGSTLVGVADTNKRLVSLARGVAKKLPLFETLDQLVDEGRPDAVVVCTPADTHASVVEAAHRKHVLKGIFVEKPLANTHQDASRIAGLAGSGSLVTLVGFQKRSIPSVVQARRWIADGLLGEPRFFRSHWLAGHVDRPATGWKHDPSSGGALLEFGIHLVDLLEWMFGPPKHVKASAARLHSERVEDFAAATLEYASGLVGVIETGWSARNYNPSGLAIEVHGTKASLTVSEDRAVLYPDSRAERDSPAEPVVLNSASAWGSLPFLFANPENVLFDRSFTDHLGGRGGSAPDFEFAAGVSLTVDRIRRAFEQSGGM